MKEVSSNRSGITITAKLECRAKDVEAVCSVSLQEPNRISVYITCSANSSRKGSKKESDESISEEVKRKQMGRSDINQWRDLKSN